MRNQIPWPDLRLRRADMLTAMVMNQIEPFLRVDDEIDGRKHASRKLREFLHTLGVEVITDFERTQAGLPLRGQEGYTEEELHHLEDARREAMMRPISIKVPLTDLR